MKVFFSFFFADADDEDDDVFIPDDPPAPQQAAASSYEAPLSAKDTVEPQSPKKVRLTMCFTVLFWSKRP